MTEKYNELTLSASDVERICVALSELRHGVNNQLSVMIAAVELMRRKPETKDRMLEGLANQIPRIQETVAAFSDLTLKVLAPKGRVGDEIGGSEGRQ